MLYSSKLVNDVQAMQATADETLAGFSVGVREAIALAEHFEKIVPEEYVMPTGCPSRDNLDRNGLMTEANIWAGAYSRL